MLLQSTEKVAKKLLVDDKIAASVREICLAIVWKFLNRKTLSGETFCFPVKMFAININ